MNVDFGKYADGLVPAIVQDIDTRDVLMLGFMNQAALDLTQESGHVTFFSRSKQRLWTKGEISGNFLEVHSVKTDCDNDTILIEAVPAGPTCHTGAVTCFGEPAEVPFHVLAELEAVIDQRRTSGDPNSYVSGLFAKGINRIAQKVGEEAVELVIAAKDDDQERFVSEAADLLFHYMILLRAKGTDLHAVTEELRARRK